MAGASTNSLKRSNSNSRAALLCHGSRKATNAGGAAAAVVVKSVSQKLKGKKKKMAAGGRLPTFGCVSLYMRAGGCRVGACDELEAEECLPRRAHLAPERCSMKCSDKMGGAEQPLLPSTVSGSSLPDDVLEIILIRLPLASLMAARCVCRKWRYMTTTPHFIQMRTEFPHQTPWLFLFGVSRDGCSAGEVQALDVSVDRWHRTGHDMLKGRSLFSVASIRADLYIVGGCSLASNSSAPAERSSVRTDEGVLVFSPLTGSWRKAAPMKSPRSTPVLGVSEVPLSCSIFRRRPDQKERIQLKSRIGAVSDVYEDPHRFSLRRQLRDAFAERDDEIASRSKASKPVGKERESERKFALIAIGGRGHRDEPLETGEIYDPLSNRWIEIARLPGDFGTVCSGAIRDGVFYVYSEADRLAGYNLERDFWVTIQISRPPPCIREYYPKLVSCLGRLFLLCVSWSEREGQLNRREKAVRKLWELDVPLSTWKEVSRHPDAPMDWNAAFVADRDRIYGVEMFRIFGQVLDFLTACHVSDTELKWTRISRKNVAHEADASLCTTKSMAVLHL